MLSVFPYYWYLWKVTKWPKEAKLTPSSGHLQVLLCSVLLSHLSDQSNSWGDFPESPALTAFWGKCASPHPTYIVVANCTTLDNHVNPMKREKGLADLKVLLFQWNSKYGHTFFTGHWHIRDVQSQGCHSYPRTLRRLCRHFRGQEEVI